MTETSISFVRRHQLWCPVQSARTPGPFRFSLPDDGRKQSGSPVSSHVPPPRRVATPRAHVMILDIPARHVSTTAVYVTQQMGSTMSIVTCTNKTARFPL